ncbi:hypothetical protein BCR34DRAFT_513497 [Clohesyomyces aquaticus]|uniref:Phosphotransferase n=1 Tax=Clohesyomyces aquaticus TaxID=1231657 RepID=A0A1Y1ZNZ4_9PLEO|nr:hypothetical protein BCR34DRAFT_513497 [Clohesyomyces aquaticus]
MRLHRYLSWIQRLCWPSTSAKNDSEEAEEVREHETKLAKHSYSNIDAIKRISLQETAERIASEFEFSDKDVRRAVEGFVRQMNEGLKSPGCAIEQLPSFITEVPTGREEGTYLAVDLGGTNVRICSVTLNGDGTYALLQDKMPIPVALMTSATSNALFLWVATMVREFLRKHYPGSLKSDTTASIFDLGFTFSHAVDQININSGTLIRWSKGFDIDGVVGQDICALLQNVFVELDVPVRVTALINDTVGTLMARAYASPQSAKTILGAVFGTGTNGAYVEQASRITKLDGVGTGAKGSIMIVNSEWGNFDQKLQYLPTTSFDRAIDAGSVNPGFEMFEKRISGMYLGEILRLAILSLTTDPKVRLFAGTLISTTSKLYAQWGLDSSFMSHLESDATVHLSVTRTQIEEYLDISIVSYEELEAIRIISHAIGRRSARLSAVALGAVILQTDCLRTADKGRIDVGVDGSLIALYPGFLAEMRTALKAVEEIGAEGEGKIDILLARDGSGVGAALAAHIAGKVVDS